VIFFRTLHSFLVKDVAAVPTRTRTLAESPGIARNLLRFVVVPVNNTFVNFVSRDTPRSFANVFPTWLWPHLSAAGASSSLGENSSQIRFGSGSLHLAPTFFLINHPHFSHSFKKTLLVSVTNPHPIRVELAPHSPARQPLWLEPARYKTHVPFLSLSRNCEKKCVYLV
jgi:hypothetical protein